MRSRKADLLGIPPIAPWLIALLFLAILAAFQWGWLGLMMLLAIAGLSLVVLSRSGAAPGEHVQRLAEPSNWTPLAMGAVTIAASAVVLLIAWKTLNGSGVFESLVVILALAAFALWAVSAARVLGLGGAMRDRGRPGERRTPRP